MNNSTIVPFPASTATPAAVVAVDVSMDDLHCFVQLHGLVVERTLANRTHEIEKGLTELRERARQAGFAQVVVTAEPTGAYHELLFATALRLGMKTDFVNAEAVAKLRTLESNDPGKTDKKDPRVIALVAGLGKTIKHRVLAEPYQLLRQHQSLYTKAETGVVEAKCAIHTHIKALFPDFTFKKDFIYGVSGRALFAGFGFNPYRIVAAGKDKFRAAMKRLAPRIKNKSIELLFEQALASALRLCPERLHKTRELALRQTFEDLALNNFRKTAARTVLEQLYDEIRALDPKLPPPQSGVISKIALARFVAETGPLSDFASHRQLLRFVGLNLVEHQSGKFRGKTKIAKKGRSLARKIADQIVLPLVKRNGLFGKDYHRMRSVQKMPGTKAMTAMARRFVKLLFGWYKSGRAFDIKRVTVCQSQFKAAA